MHIHLGLIFLLGIAFVTLWFFGITGLPQSQSASNFGGLGNLYSY